MKKEKIIFTTVLIFLATIYLSLIQSIFHIFKEPTLVGLTKKINRPHFSLTSWFDKSFQDGFEKWWDNRLGLKGYFVKTDNQINFWLFREIHQKTNQKIIVGKDNYLFEKNYIDSLIGRDYQSIEKIREKVKKLKTLQELLARRGISFVLLIAPSKASFYPEYIPSYLISETSEKNPVTNYEKVIPELLENKINYFDGHEYLLSQKKTSQYPLFAKSGTHWTRYGSCLVAQKVFQQAGKQFNKNYKTADCDNVAIFLKPQEEDTDLADLSNLWFPKIFYQTLAYPKFPKNEPVLNDINFLMVGDSFSWGFLKNVVGSRLVNDYNFYYYFNTDYDYSNQTKEIDKSDMGNLRQEILKRNLVIIEANDASLGNIGFEFVDAAISALK